MLVVSGIIAILLLLLLCRVLIPMVQSLTADEPIRTVSIGSRRMFPGSRGISFFGKRHRTSVDAKDADTSYSVKDSVLARQLMDCKTWYALFERIEADQKDKVLPCSVKNEIESAYLRVWTSGQDHHADAPHGDAPHSDSHGDSPHGDAHADSSQTYEGGIPGVLLNGSPELFNS